MKKLILLATTVSYISLINPSLSYADEYSDDKYDEDYITCSDYADSVNGDYSDLLTSCMLKKGHKYEEESFQGDSEEDDDS